MTVDGLASDRLAPAPDVASGVPVVVAGLYRDFVEGHLDEAYRLATFILGDRGRAEDPNASEPRVGRWSLKGARRPGRGYTRRRLGVEAGGGRGLAVAY